MGTPAYNRPRPIPAWTQAIATRDRRNAHLAVKYIGAVLNFGPPAVGQVT